jgi:PKD repeat protein
MKRLIAFVAMVTIAGCSLDKQTAPPLTGPSELGLSLAVTATPDIITQDGQSQATIQVIARDANSQPVSGLTLRADMYVDGQLTDFGTLSAKTISTGADGRAAMVYQAPKAPSPVDADSRVVTIAVTPVNGNYAAATMRQVDLKLVRPGVIVPPGDGPVAAFFFSPTSPKADDDVFFDGSSSTGSIVSYRWSYGDGRTDVSGSPTARHHFDIPGTYSVVLTVADALGRVSSSAPKTVTIAAVADPTADFVVSPSAPKSGEPVFFNASLSKGSAGHTISNYTWDFGDGTPLVSSSSALINHAFAGSVAGTTYKVTLVVTDDNGRTNAKASDVTVKN